MNTNINSRYEYDNNYIIVIDSKGSDFTNNFFSCKLSDSINISEYSEIYIESITTKGSKSNKNKNDLSFLLDLKGLVYDVKSNISLCNNKLLIPNQSNNDNEIFIHKGSKLNYNSPILPSKISQIIGEITNLNNETIFYSDSVDNRIIIELLLIPFKKKNNEKEIKNSFYDNSRYISDNRRYKIILSLDNLYSNLSFNKHLDSPLNIDTECDIYIDSITFSDTKYEINSDFLGLLLNIDQFNIRNDTNNINIKDKLFLPCITYPGKEYLSDDFQSGILDNYTPGVTPNIFTYSGIDDTDNIPHYFTGMNLSDSGNDFTSTTTNGEYTSFFVNPSNQSEIFSKLKIIHAPSHSLHLDNVYPGLLLIPSGSSGKIYNGEPINRDDPQLNLKDNFEFWIKLNILQTNDNYQFGLMNKNEDTYWSDKISDPELKDRHAVFNDRIVIHSHGYVTHSGHIQTVVGQTILSFTSNEILEITFTSCSLKNKSKILFSGVTGTPDINNVKYYVKVTGGISGESTTKVELYLDKFLTKSVNRNGNTYSGGNFSEVDDLTGVAFPISTTNVHNRYTNNSAGTGIGTVTSSSAFNHGQFTHFSEYLEEINSYIGLKVEYKEMIINADITNGGNYITNIRGDGINDILEGMYITGTGIPDNSIINTIDTIGNQFKISYEFDPITTGDYPSIQTTTTQENVILKISGHILKFYWHPEIDPISTNHLWSPDISNNHNQPVSSFSTKNIQVIGPKHIVLPRKYSPIPGNNVTSSSPNNNGWAIYIGDTTSGSNIPMEFSIQDFSTKSRDKTIKSNKMNYVGNIKPQKINNLSGSLTNLVKQSFFNNDSEKIIFDFDLVKKN